MIAKLIVHGKDRSDAIQRMAKAIADYTISGIGTTLPFGHFVMKSPAFLTGQFDTNFVKHHYATGQVESLRILEKEIAAKAALKIFLEVRKQLNLPSNIPSNWKLNRLKE